MKRYLFFLLFLLSVSVFGQSFDVKYGTFRQYFLMVPMASPPSAPVKGMAYMDTDGQMYVYNGSSWVSIVSQWTLSGSDITNANAGTVIVDSLFKIYPMPPGVLAAHDNPYKFMVMGNDGRVWWANSLTASQIIDDTVSDQAAAGDPPVTATWVRDTTNGFVVLADSTDLVGIGTTTPLAPMHISDGILSTGVINSGWVVPSLGAGERLMWAPYNASFRAGSLSAEVHNWDNDSIGAYSFSFGEDTKSLGTYSFSAGAKCYAIGAASIAIGNNNISYAPYSTALNFYTTAYSYNSTVIGRFNENVGSSASWVDSDPLFVIGNGTGGPGADSLRDCFVVYKNGDVKAKNYLEASDSLYVAGNAEFENDVNCNSGVSISGDLTVIDDVSADTATAAYFSGSGARGYTICFNYNSTSMADATTYYMGQSSLVFSTTADANRTYILKNGTIKGAVFSMVSTAAGTNEDISVYIRLNNTTDYLIATIGDTGTSRYFKNTSLSVAVTTSDYFEIKIVTPTWATNPTSPKFGGYLYIE